MAIPVKQSDPVHPSMQEHVLGCVHSILVPHPLSHTAMITEYCKAKNS